ncbi:hypothetical protein G6F57_014654 [Rhizopus arrhizus]|uniref:Uncharacterized protein n=1 Tax=Rhizopus oryzae TaxID=64495 RepID=A0A9P6WXD3_RHIOR|nr:hypothetical protein G6F24_013022 [Rhizopus arrhizus]KAG1395338.1 hypothetical protein G6F58_011950 [Rhizopus delemar]KAG0776956.1 hypothetical protein G6F22_012205 [Rhizopus arrhizus]KAG0819413.1 hypothetical protein G6F18_012747 [Rhizopus arrhizus]KAG0928327.1 hypothetical protein G6F32_012609 [Rhizopus arrhizus]
MDKTAIKKNRHDVYWQQFNHWFDSLIGHSQQQPTLPLNQQQQQQQKKRWLRLSVLFYVVFSILLTSAHCTSWFFRFLSQNTKDDFVFERTYDAGKCTADDNIYSNNNTCNRPIVFFFD